MLVSPLPGVDRKRLHQALSDVCQEASEVHSGRARGYHRYLAYLNWTNSAVVHLDSLIGAADLERLVLTRRYQQLLASPGHFGTGPIWEIVEQMLNSELQQRITEFTAAVEALGQELQRWQLRGVPVVADSSFYVKHPDRLEEADFAELLGVQDRSIHLIVPMVVVDELDQLKESKTPHARWRAGYTLAVLDRIFQQDTQQAVLRKPDAEVQRTTGVRRGEVTVQLLFDPPGHVRLPINDDEIVNRALAIQPLSGREVTVLTYDTGQATRARVAGLRDLKLSISIGDEPEQRAAPKKGP
ncbi:PIN domain-containing protein [Streptomyces flavofungini]|uniref:PIN domain-containing protein n=1 Tax=Streptomyces flavofungini TaxID=68200 RepID=UPI0025B047B9|nr:PIN domain-containing protein [Streptomyces flavofungini]WJV46200.1 PIN domain-containing protein [Streptomyces flavofungini]